MRTTVRTLRIALSTVLAWLPAATALAQPVEAGSDTDSPGLIILLTVFCLIVVGSLAYTARKMAKLP